MKKAMAAAALLGAVLVFPLVQSNPYYLRLATTLALYVVLTSGLNLQVGLAGLLNMGYVAFYAIGAYVYALLSSPQLGLSLPSPLAFCAGVLASVVASLAIGFPTLRLRDDYLAVVTLGFSEIVRILLLNLDKPVNITNGPNGIINIYPLKTGLFSADSPSGAYYLMMAFAALATFAYVKLARSRLGLELRAIKGDVLASSSFGIDVSRARIMAFAIGAAFAGTAGVLFASWQGAIFPQNFTMNELIVLYCMIILGGIGNPAGTFVGIALLVLLPEALRSYSVYRMLLYGASLVLMMLFRPQGVFPAGGWHKNRPDQKRVMKIQEQAFRETPCPLPENDNGGLPVLEVKCLTKRFGGLTALEDVSFSVFPGQVTGIIGPNGAGKTTLLNVLTGLTPATSGQFVFQGQPLSGLGAADIYRLGLTRTFQNLRLWEGLSVLENVLVGRAGHRTISESQAISCLEFVSEQLCQKAFEPAVSLSYASRKHLEIARAIASNPGIVLFDEPAAGMNTREIEELKRKIAVLTASGRAVLLVEHRMSLVMGLSDVLVVLDHGRKIAEGPPESVCSDPEVIRVYLGEQKKQCALAVHDRAHERESEKRAKLEIRGLQASYGSIKVLHGIDMRVDEGEVVSVLGNNGAGKTTTIKTVLGMLKPEAGTVTLNGKDVTGWPSSRIIECGAAVVPEGRRVFSRMTVEENLLTGGHGAGRWEKLGFRPSLDRVYGLFPLLFERRHQKAGTLSGGEQQMLAIGRALVASPELLLLDEPSMGLAPLMVDRILEAILEINRGGTTVLMVEQNAVGALNISHRGYILQNGRVVKSGYPQELLSNKSLHEAYF